MAPEEKEGLGVLEKQSFNPAEERAGEDHSLRDNIKERLDPGPHKRSPSMARAFRALCV